MKIWMHMYIYAGIGCINVLVFITHTHLFTPCNIIRDRFRKVKIEATEIEIS